MSNISTTIKYMKYITHFVLQISAFILFIVLSFAAYLFYEAHEEGKESIKQSEIICNSIENGSNINEFISKAKDLNITYYAPSDVNKNHSFHFRAGFEQRAYCEVKTEGNAVISKEFKLYLW